MIKSAEIQGNELRSFEIWCIDLQNLTKK